MKSARQLLSARNRIVQDDYIRASSGKTIQPKGTGPCQSPIAKKAGLAD